MSYIALDYSEFELDGSGQPMVPPSPTTIHVRGVDEHMYRGIRILAERWGVTVADVIHCMWSDFDAVNAPKRIAQDGQVLSEAPITEQRATPVGH